MTNDIDESSIVLEIVVKDAEDVAYDDTTEVATKNVTTTIENNKNNDNINPSTTNDTTTITNSYNNSNSDDNDNVICNNDTILLSFVDGRQIFAFCSNTERKKSIVKIQKRTYTTYHLIGLSYGTIIELHSHSHTLVPLPYDAKLIPDLIHPSTGVFNNDDDDNDEIVEDDDLDIKDNNNNSNNNYNDNTDIVKDNRHLIDTNTAQSLQYNELLQMKLLGYNSNDIISSLVQNSSTYIQKTKYAQEKYILRKQMKYNKVRCRIIKCNATTIVDALYNKDCKKYMNIRSDTVGQILSYSNICGGCTTLVYDDCYGLILGCIAERMNTYGIIYSIYTGQQPSYTEMLQKFNLNFEQLNIIKYIHSGDIFTQQQQQQQQQQGSNNPVAIVTNNNDYINSTTTTTAITTTTTTTVNDHSNEQNDDKTVTEIDYERIDRERLIWPCPLQDHTRQYLQQQQLETDSTSNNNNISNFLIKRASRFARKLCRMTTMEGKQHLLDSCQKNDKLCDSLILVTKYNPITTLIQLFPYLAPSAPYVIYCEYIEPLTECFKCIQSHPQLLSINLRLSNTWMREYQILPNRTHPNMSMSQSGGFILTGIKLHPITGYNELNDVQLQSIRNEMGGLRRRARQNRSNKKVSSSSVPIDKTNRNNNNNNHNNKKRKETSS